MKKCLRCNTGKKFTIREWNECPWQKADWDAGCNWPFLPRWLVRWWYFRNDPQHLIQELPTNSPTL